MASSVPALNCTDAMRQLWDYLDHELTEDRMEAVRRHLESCSDCLPHHDFERAFLVAVAATKRTGASPPGLRVKVMDALRRQGLTSGPNGPSS